MLQNERNRSLPRMFSWQQLDNSLYRCQQQPAHLPVVFTRVRGPVYIYMKREYFSTEFALAVIGKHMVVIATGVAAATAVGMGVGVGTIVVVAAEADSIPQHARDLSGAVQLRCAHVWVHIV